MSNADRMAMCVSLMRQIENGLKTKDMQKAGRAVVAMKELKVKNYDLRSVSPSTLEVIKESFK